MADSLQGFEVTWSFRFVNPLVLDPFKFPALQELRYDVEPNWSNPSVCRSQAYELDLSQFD